MAEPVTPPAKSPLSNLSPQQRRYAIVAGAGAVLALIVLLSRRSDSDAAEAPVAEDTGAAPVDPYDPYLSAGAYGAAPYEFTDPGAFGGQLSTALTDSLGDVQEELLGLRQEGRRQNERLQRQLRALRQQRRRGGGGGRGRRPPGTKPRRRNWRRDLPDKPIF